MMPGSICWPSTRAIHRWRCVTGARAARSGGSRSRRRGGKQPWTSAARSAADWKPAPALREALGRVGRYALAGYDGMMWYRARVTLTKAQAKQAATLALGAVDDVDIAWINGRAMGIGFR